MARTRRRARRGRGARHGSASRGARLAHAALNRSFGPPRFDPEAHPGEPGLFGPASPTWRVIGDHAAMVGGFRALLVQLCHPLATAGVADHSSYGDETLPRLQNTTAYVTTTAFGATREALDASRVVRRVHRSVVGTAPDGRLYAAGDPHLLAWVSIALTSSFLAAHRAYGADPLAAADEDRFVAEQSRAAALLDPRADLEALPGGRELAARLADGRLDLPMVEEGRLPTDVAGVERTLAAYRGELAINHQGRETLRFLLRPNLSPAMRAGYYPLLGGALASLDAHERELLALSGLRAAAPVLRAQTRALLGLLRRATPTTPSHQAATGRIARRPPDSPVEAASSRRHRARSAAAARYPGSGW